MPTDRTIDYFMAPQSPFTYLGHARVVALARAHHATLAIKPMNLARVFPASGGLPLAQRAPQRQAYRLVELRRWSTLLALPFNVQPRHFPMPGEPAALWILAALEVDATAAAAFVGAIGHALWAEERNPADPATLEALADACGLPGTALATRATAPDVAARYDAITDEALARGVFGAPTYMFRNEMYWGQDRLDFLARALAQ